MKSTWKLGLIILAIVGALGLSVLFGVKNIENKAIGFEENIFSANASISKEEQRRIDLFSNLVDAIESYNDYEQSAFTKIVEARKQASTGNIEEAAKTLDVVIEKYPELKSQENYKTAMTEFSITENRLAEHRENYNNSVRSYNRYVRKFPSKQLLSIQGYEVVEYTYLDFKVDNSKATDLFGK